MTHCSALTRRDFLRGAALIIAASAGTARAAEPGAKPVLTAGLLTDVHHANKDTRGSRHYRDSLGKLREAVDFFNAQRPAFVAHLGDLIDAGEDIEQEHKHLEQVEAVLARLEPERRYVLGNHCVDGLTKEEFLAQTPLDRPYDAFERAGIRFITLDACYRADGVPYGRRNFEWTDANIPAAQLAWLDAELARDSAPAILFVHQRLDEAGNYSVRNAAEVRAVIEKRPEVLAVFQGHSHRHDCQRIHGVHYCTLAAMIEGPGPGSSAYALLHVFGDGSLRIEGMRQQPSAALDA